MSTNSRSHSVNDCESILELLPDYAFGLTSAEDTRWIEANIATCPEAAAQLADYQHLQDDMRADVPQINPPAALEARLMAAIAVPTQSALPPKTRRSITIRWGWVTAAAAMVALVLTNVYWLGRVNTVSVPPKSSDSTSAHIAVQGDSTFVLTSASDLRWVRLPPSQQNVDAAAVLLWNSESKIGLLYVRGFPSLSAGKTFQLWLTKGDDRASAGLFRVDENGNGALLFNITDAIDKYTWARITEEPVDGSSQPSDQVVVIGEL
ncbi:MAG: anti-sigma factor [Chloroflexota bacterium]